MKYNPFKMVGSWIGAGVALIPAILLGLGVLGGAAMAGPHSAFDTEWGWLIFLPAFLVPFALVIVAGFLVGWGVHSLVRRLSK